MSDSSSRCKTPFISRSDDDATLWEVKEITEESSNKYKVICADIDPENRKPWTPSWVSKSDFTDVAVGQWEVKKRSKVNPKNVGGGNANANARSKFGAGISPSSDDFH